MLEAERKQVWLSEKGSAVGLKVHFQPEQGRILLPVQLGVSLSEAVLGRDGHWPF